MRPAPRIRAPQRDDLEEIVALLVLCDVAAYGVPDTSVEDVAADWDLQDFDLASDAWVAEDMEESASPSPRIVGYAYAGDQLRTGELEGDVFVDPRASWSELGGALLDRVEQRAAELAAVNGYPAARLRIFAAEVSDDKRAQLAARGFAARRRFFRMEIDLGPGFERLHAPPGFALRAFRRDADDRAMYDTMMAAFADVRQSDEPFDAWRQRLLGHGDFDPGLWFLAFEGGRPVGALIAYDHGGLGWVKGLGVLRPWRRRGLGGALLSTAFSAFAARGCVRVGLGVDADAETAPRLYARAGLRVTQAHDLFEKRLAGNVDNVPPPTGL